MKSKIFKIITVTLLLATLLLANFIYVGNGLISYAISSSATNHQNVEFDAQLKDENILSIQVSVKKEGYFNGEIVLENSNFNLKQDQSNSYINKIEGNKITLNQLNAGAVAQIDLQIEPIKDEIINVGLLNAVSKLSLSGIYRDSTEKNIQIKATKEITYQYPEKNTEENVENSIEIITNKVTRVSGEEKRVLQLSVNLGLKDNNYPIKQLTFDMKAPKTNVDAPKVEKKVNFNTMTHYQYEYDGENLKIVFDNNPNQDNKILWEKQGNENVVLTFIYDKEVELENKEFIANQAITLYSGKTLLLENTFTVNNEEKEALIQVESKNTESTIYKGKLYAGIDRQYESKTNIAVNLENAESYINVKESSTQYIGNDQEVSANVVYNKTLLKKDKFDSIFGENGSLNIANENGQIIAMINSKTPVDENNNIVIDYSGREPTAIEITTTIPIAVGDLELVHTKTIKARRKGNY